MTINTPIECYQLSDSNRSAHRRFMYLGTWLASVPLGGLAGFSLSSGLTSFDGANWLTGIFGAGICLAARAYVEPQFRINNPTTGIFMTIDPLKALFGHKDTVTVYPPGLSYCYPWESRDAANNISLEEATVNFEFAVVCTDGMLKAKGSYRLRADQNNPIAFQTGVAAVAEDMQDLIIVHAVENFATKKISTALKSLGKVNQGLKEKFVDSKSEFETRFGVHVGDVTIGQLKPSDEVARTISALTEAAAIAIGTAKLLGFNNMNEVNKAVASGNLGRADVKEARDRFLSISGNLEGMEVKRQEYFLSTEGIDPNLAEAFIALATNAPKAMREWRQANQPQKNRRVKK